MNIVTAEFAVGKELVDECAKAVTELTESLAAKQSAFLGATITIEPSTGTVINVMRWETVQDFLHFRDSNQDTIAPAIGRFNPKNRFLNVEAEIEPK